jgi:hypothetical protein
MSGNMLGRRTKNRYANGVAAFPAFENPITAKSSKISPLFFPLIFLFVFFGAILTPRDCGYPSH